MPKYVVVVESPAKCKTIQKYLGNDYQVLASYGHVRDLPARRGSIDTEHDFAMVYEPIERNSRHVDAIAKALKQADGILLATDPDREGEAISWHIQSLMSERGLLKNKTSSRIVFNEITKSSIIEAVTNPRDIAMNLVNAQQARRALDYLVGFNLSPLLWKKVRRGLSAGRVQSPALRLIVEREAEIAAFVSEEYWSIIANCEHNKSMFNASLTHYLGEKLKQFSITQEIAAQEVLENIKSQKNLKVTKVDKKQRKRKPSPPFITSTLQQEAARKLGFTTKKTMMIAQQLYEGIELESGLVGLITYMRTDSVHMATEAINEMRAFITERYGQENCYDSVRVFKSKSKNSQESHEAIRPTSIRRSPQMVEKALSADQFKLYNLIWQRSLATQMSEAILDTVAVDLVDKTEQYVFRANGSSIAFSGFLLVYEEGRDDVAEGDDESAMLPSFQVGALVDLLKVDGKQHFTEPPPRYSEASLVKTLVEFDIGRPSTYASIINTLQQREYVVLDKKRFIPTDVATVVCRFLTEYFTRYVDYKFTAELEDTLDAIARGEHEWVPVLRDFWQPFIDKINMIDAKVQRKDVTTQVIEEKCPKCQQDLSIRLGKRGRFIGCTGYPECDYTQDLSNDKAEVEVIADRNCPQCSANLHIKAGRYGKFIGCSAYPECKFMEPLEKPKDTGVSCPKCNNSNLVKRKSRKGKIFYSCDSYPKCDYAIWHEPIAEACPKCQWPILTRKESKRSGLSIVCPHCSETT
jgi:DNA topoisomerase I